MAHAEGIGNLRGREVGVDVGVARFLTTSDGQIVSNPWFRRVG